MSFVSTVAVIGVMTIGVMYSVLKLTKWSLNADEKNVRGSHVEHVSSLYRTALAFILLIELSSGLSAWLYDAWRFIRHIGGF